MNGAYAVGFTFAGTVGGLRITSPSLDGKLVLQSADHSKGATNERTHDENGAVMVSAWLDPHDKATLEEVIRGTDYAASDFAALIDLPDLRRLSLIFS